MTETKEIRKQLKETLGYNAKQVSVRQSRSQITFTIRDAAVNKKAVIEFGNNFESISRDYATGEILCGGNTFVNVVYADTVRKELVDTVIEQVKKAVAKITDNYLIPVEGTNFTVGRDHMGISVWKNEDTCGSFVSNCYNEETAAFLIATA